MKNKSSFQIALAALESNNLDTKAVKALRVCEAADDLLEALEGLLNYKNLGAYDRAFAMKAASAAIAKAKGE